MANQFVPWDKYPDLTEARLSAVAQIISTVRRDAVILHAPSDGDGAWSLGCRSYERTVFALRNAARGFDWLRILPDEKALRFTFSIGTVPCRFYRGDPDDPPSRYLEASWAELRQARLAFDLGVTVPDGIIRFAIEAPPAGMITGITLVEMDQGRTVIGLYDVPLQVASSRVVSMQARPVSLPPPTVEPLEDMGNATQERDASSK
jgi:hypothetical protein